MNKLFTKRLFFFSSIVALVFVVLYSALWVFVMWSAAAVLNQEYAGKPIVVTSDPESPYTVQFDHLTPAGFPFKFAVKLHGWHEDGHSSEFSLKAPMLVGYDLLRCQWILSYSGSGEGRYKPLVSGFGAGMEVEEYTWIIKMPPSVKMLKILFNLSEHNPIELLNFVRKIEHRITNLKITDLVDHKVIYSVNNYDSQFWWHSQHYYVSKEDLLNYMPQDIAGAIDYKIGEGDDLIVTRIIPTNLLYNFFYLIESDGQAKFIAKFAGGKWQEWSDNMELEFTSAGSNKHQEGDLSLSVLSQKEQENHTVNVKMLSNSELKSGFFDQLALVFNAVAHIPYSGGGKSYTLGDILPSLKDKKRLEEFENHKYKLNFDISTRVTPYYVQFYIKNFDLTSGQVGIGIDGDIQCKTLGNCSAEGNVVINKADRLIDFATDQIYNIKGVSDAASNDIDLDKQIIKIFLKNISDYPNSTSEDLSFAYHLNHTVRDPYLSRQSTIGSVQLDQIEDKLIEAAYLAVSRHLIAGKSVMETIKLQYPFLFVNESVVKRFQLLEEKYLQAK